MKEGFLMGGPYDNKRFHPGERAPNDGYYFEIGETGSSVETPARIHLHEGEKFPDCANQDRVWTHRPKKA
jgi:hypothetical protein